MINILFRTIFFYFFVIVMLRIMGKREVGQLGVVDLVVFLLIAELVAISIEKSDQSIFLTIVPVVALVILEITLAYLSLKSRRFRNFFDGKPSLIIEKGRLNYSEMVKQRYTIDDLLFELRQKGIKSLETVDYALLEANGKLSIFEKRIVDKSYPLALIVDGEIQEVTLKKIKKTRTWLNFMLYKNNINLEDVFYGFYKGSSLFIIRKKDLINVK